MNYLFDFPVFITTLNLLLLSLVSVSSSPPDSVPVKRSDDNGLASLQTVQQQQSEVIQQLLAEVRTLQTKVTSLESLESRVASSEGLIAKLRQKVAFTAYFNEGGPVNIGESAPVSFIHVSANVGNGYNPQTGVFTAPVAGVYLFLLNVKADTATEGTVKLGIYKSGSPLMMVDVEPHNIVYKDQSDAFITVHVNAGETVLVRHVEGATVIDRWYETSFAGILLYAD